MITFQPLRPVMPLYQNVFSPPSFKQIDILNEIKAGNANALDKLSDEELNNDVDMQFAGRPASSMDENIITCFYIFQDKAKLFHAIAESGNDQVIDKLVSRNIDLNQCSEFKSTLNGFKPVDGSILHHVLLAHEKFHNPQEVIKKLIESGAMVNISNSTNYSFVDLLQSDYKNTAIYQEIMPYLEEHGLTNLEKISYSENLAINNELIDAYTSPLEEQFEEMPHQQILSGETNNYEYLNDWF
jgi:ankyrin repeat protein